MPGLHGVGRCRYGVVRPNEVEKARTLVAGAHKVTDFGAKIYTATRTVSYR